jgi:hypothetical protein
MNGTDSWMEVPELEKTLSQSLQGSGHAKLDLLDFDACLMGQSTVLDHMNSVADDVVASASYEKGSTQNLNAWLTDLLQNPEMDGEALGNTIVHDAVANTLRRPGRPDEHGTAANEALDQEPFLSEWKPTKAEFDKNVERQLDSAKNEGAWSNFITAWSKAHQ